MSFTEDDVEINTHKSIKMPMEAWRHRSVISAHRMWKQKDQDFKARLECTAGSRPEGDTGEALPHLPTSESVSPLQLSCYFQFTGREAEAQDLKDFPRSTGYLQS